MRINVLELIGAIKANILREMRAGATKQDIEKHKRKLLDRWNHPTIQHFVNSIDYDKIKEYYDIK